MNKTTVIRSWIPPWLARRRVSACVRESGGTPHTIQTLRAAPGHCLHLRASVWTAALQRRFGLSHSTVALSRTSAEWRPPRYLASFSPVCARMDEDQNCSQSRNHENDPNPPWDHAAGRGLHLPGMVQDAWAGLHQARLSGAGTGCPRRRAFGIAGTGCPRPIHESHRTGDECRPAGGSAFGLCRNP